MSGAIASRGRGGLAGRSGGPRGAAATAAQPTALDSRRVVVAGVDGSARGRAALRWARWLAELTGGGLVPVTVVDEPARSAQGRPAVPHRAWVDHLEDMAREAGWARALEPRVLCGRPAESLLELAHRLGAGALVVGSAGCGADARGARTVSLGSVAFRLAHAADVPLLVVPSAAPPPPARHVVVGVDDSAAAAAACCWAAGLAARAGAAVAAVRVLRPGAADTLAVDPEPWCGVPDADLLVVRAAAPCDVLLTVADESGAELVVIGRRGTRSLSPRDLGGVANDLLHETRRALAVVPAVQGASLVR